MIYFNGIKGKNYFEGWFFRVCNERINCALIPSISVCDGKIKAYIQLNCNGFSRKIEFPHEEFLANNHCVLIGDNKFSDKGIKFSCDELSLDVTFSDFTSLEKDIMGCFKFGTPCKHKLISMKHYADGKANLLGAEINIDKAVCYIEKDWGKSFPKSYCWLQCNDFEQSDVAFFLSVADIGFPFDGLICVLLVGDTEYRFATYNFSKILELNNGKIVLQKSNHKLEIFFNGRNAKQMIAPERGDMKNIIKEDLDGEICLKLYDCNNLLFESSGKNVGIEWVNLDDNN